MATTTIGAPGVTFPDGSVQASKGASGDVIMNVYTSSGTWTKPATVKSIKVTVVGGGGSGGTATSGSLYPSMLAPSRHVSRTGGGGGGGYSVKTYPAASLPGPQPYIVGGATAPSSFGGTAPVITASGGSNSASITAPGSSGGGTAYTAGGAGGAGSGGNLNLVGGPGVPGQNGGLGGNSITSTLVASIFGVSAGNPGVLYGGGATGANSGTSTPTLSLAGGTGAQGVVIVEEFY
jgi:hypothetical protein